MQKRSFTDLGRALLVGALGAAIGMTTVAISRLAALQAF